MLASLLFSFMAVIIPSSKTIAPWADLERHADEVMITPYLADDSRKAPTVIVCPGGSYHWLDVKGEGIEVAEWLQAQPEVAWINYAGLPGNKYYELARKYMPKGTCGVIAFGLKGTRQDAIRFMDNLEFISIVTHVADARTCVLHPASHTHRQLSDEQLREAGVAPDLIRLSVGIEDCDDILADIQQALEKI